MNDVTDLAAPTRPGSMVTCVVLPIETAVTPEPINSMVVCAYPTLYVESPIPTPDTTPSRFEPSP